MINQILQFFSFSHKDPEYDLYDPSVDLYAEDKDPENGLGSWWFKNLKDMTEDLSDDSNIPESERDSRRRFTAATKRKCWSKAKSVKGRDPSRWKEDIAGNLLFKKFTNCYGPLCY